MCLTRNYRAYVSHGLKRVLTRPLFEGRDCDLHGRSSGLKNRSYFVNLPPQQTSALPLFRAHRSSLIIPLLSQSRFAILFMLDQVPFGRSAEFVKRNRMANNTGINSPVLQGEPGNSQPRVNFGSPFTLSRGNLVETRELGTMVGKTEYRPHDAGFLSHSDKHPSSDWACPVSLKSSLLQRCEGAGVLRFAWRST